jgi:signal transduction histidine kinase
MGAGTDYLRFVELRHPDGRAISDADRPSQRAVRGEMVAGFDEIVYNRVTGEERHVIVNAAPIPDDEGGIAGAVLVAHDVTALRAAERVKDEFLLVASHELKTLLTPLTGLLQIMDTLVTRAEQGRPLDYARLRRYLRMMVGRVDRLVELVAAMLDLSRLQAGLFALDLAPVDLVPLTAEVLARFADGLEAREEGRHHLVLEAPAPVVASCDPNRVEQVLTNLVENALKYSPGGGPVLVRVTQESNQAVLTVDDEGIGIPEGEVDSLFRPFARGSNTPALQYAGVGLGLYICREIVERHGGSIGAGPRDPTGARPGTSFRVTLPLAGPQPVGCSAA